MNVPGAFPDADEANETMNENGRNAPGLVNRFDDDGDDDGMMDDDGMLDDDDDPVSTDADRPDRIADYDSAVRRGRWRRAVGRDAGRR